MGSVDGSAPEAMLIQVCMTKMACYAVVTKMKVPGEKFQATLLPFQTKNRAQSRRDKRD